MVIGKRIQDGALFCTGFWKIAGNQKRSSTHYERLLPNTMRLLSGSRLHLFYDDPSTLEHFAAEAVRNQIDLSATKVAIKELPTFDDVLPILSTCERLVEAGEHRKEMPAREKKSVHLKRDYHLSGAKAFRELLTIWTSKILLLSELSRSAPMEVERINWIDTSVSRFNGSRTNWNFLKHHPNEGRVAHYASPMFFNGEPLPLNASFMGAARDVWPTIERLFLEQLRMRAGDGYVHDEETIMSYVIAQNPELFQVIGRPVRGAKRFPIKIASKLDEFRHATGCNRRFP